MKTFVDFLTEAKIKLKNGETVEIDQTQFSGILKKHKDADRSVVSLLKAMGKK